MPYNKHAKITITNKTEEDLTLYYHIDYEKHQQPQKDMLQFHAYWNHEKTKKQDKTINLTDKDNYQILHATGRGHYVGTILSVKTNSPGWWGEGDDMIIVDDEPWPPSIHGTGTEDYFCSSYGFTANYYAPYSGVIQMGDTYDWTGKWTVYRFHIEDPIPFKKSIRVSIEHGHANNRDDTWTSTAYWYQTEPHKKQPPIEDRLTI